MKKDADFTQFLRAANRALEDKGLILKRKPDLGGRLHFEVETIRKASPVKIVEPEARKIPEPKVGDKVYVPTQMSIDHGEDDIQGGLATISEVKDGISGGRKVPFIRVAELPDEFSRSWNWEFIFSNQERWSREYKNRVARPDPDYG